MTTTAFKPIQKVYALSTLAGTPSDQHGTVDELEAYAQKIITATLANPTVQVLIGQWNLVWGPAVHQVAGSDVADNAFYIAQNSATPTEFVIAISGTNPISRYGWIDEDFLINPLQPWPFGNTAQNFGDGADAGNLGKTYGGTGVDTHHTWSIALSASPLSIGAKDQYGLYVSVEYL